jgi:hypothetical protein
MKKSIVTIILVIIAFTGNAQSHTSILNGVWVGKGYQLNSNETWSIKLIVENEQINIEYPSLKCKSKLNLYKTDGNKFYFIEKITQQSTCTDNGRIVLEFLSPNDVRFKYYRPNGEPNAFSDLIRFE